MSRPQVHLRVPGARGHLFFFRKMIARADRDAMPGSLVDVIDNRGGTAGVGFYNPLSEIAVRLLSTQAEESDTFLRDRLRAAIQFRQQTLRLPEATDAYRLCHAEGDGLTGLIVDRFGPVVVAQIFSRGWVELLEELKTELADLLPGTKILVTTDEKAARLEGFTLPPEHSPAPVVVTEHGARFKVNFATGHKTGFFCDQRDNRRDVAALAKSRSMLDLCCYTGGFAIQAARAGAKKVVAVDLDEDALATAKRNAKLNEVNIELVHADIFDKLRALPEKSEFDLVVLDPAKLARNKLELPRALHMYYDMNLLALKVAAPGAIFVTCSCSGLVPEEQFLEIVRDAARDARREMRIFKIAGAGPDHPVSSLYPEGRYLKAVYATVV